MKKTFLYSAMMLSAFALTACSDDNYGDPAVDLQGTTQFVNAQQEKGFQTYYKPQLGTVGDPMPFFDPKAGDFKIMYLQEFPDAMKAPGRYHPYWTVSTKDGASYKSEGEWLSVGEFDTQQDAILGTGCCTYDAKSGLYYIYYTGESEKTANRQVVMRATSADLKTWTRDNLWRLQGPDFGLSGNDFRDPQIFKVGDEYHMIVSTKPFYGGDPCFAEFKSADLKSWEHVGNIKMIWDRMLECPDVFEMNGKWYLVYSECVPAVWSRKVKYMMGNSWEDLKAQFNDGPKWPDVREGRLDSRAFYAAKTASNGTDRYIWGWCPERPDGDNANVGNGSEGQGNEPLWSGALVCHKVAQHEDGTLYLTAVPAIAAKYKKTAEVKVMEKGDNYTLYNRLGNHNHISFTVKLTNRDDKFGVSFGRGTGDKDFVTLKFNNPHWDEWNKHLRRVEYYVGNGVEDRFIDGADGDFFPFAEDNTYNIDIYTDNSVVVMYVNGTGCMTSRIYGLQKNCWSINSYADGVEVSNVKVSQY